MNTFDIYYDSLTELTWFKKLSPYFKNARSHLIKSRGENPDIIKEILKYDKPDIILIYNGSPVLVLEKSSEVPTGHNVGQRFARLVRAIELNIPTIYFFPFDARKHGEYSNICHLNIRLLEATFNIIDIHQVPLLPVNWLTDSNGEIITSGKENEELKILINDYIKHKFNPFSPRIVSYIKFLKREYEERLKEYPPYADMPTSVKEQKTDYFCEKHNISNFNKEFLENKLTYIYKIGMTPPKCKRQDPYTGTQFIYDYIACRTGEHPSDKKNNLVLYFPKITQETWHNKNPKNFNTKSGNWYLTANAFLFKDGFEINTLKNRSNT